MLLTILPAARPITSEGVNHKRHLQSTSAERILGRLVTVQIIPSGDFFGSCLFISYDKEPLATLVK
jgi:hypothetical protein